MMTYSFHLLTPEETKTQYPRYSREDITCYQILKNAQRVGLYGLIDRGVDRETHRRQGEGFLTVFSAFRFQVLSKAFFKSLFAHTFSMGFDTVYTWTRLISWQKVFERFASSGIYQLPQPPAWDPDPTKVWFVKGKGD